MGSTREEVAITVLLWLPLCPYPWREALSTPSLQSPSYCKLAKPSCHGLFFSNHSVLLSCQNTRHDRKILQSVSARHRTVGVISPCPWKTSYPSAQVLKDSQHLWIRITDTRRLRAPTIFVLNDLRMILSCPRADRRCRSWISCLPISPLFAPRLIASDT